MIHVSLHTVRATVALLALLAVTATYGQEEAVTPSSPPRIACDEATFDFVQADMGSTVSHSFIIKNEGTETLKIGYVKPGCGCTAAKMSATEIPGGGQAELKASLSLVNRRGYQKKYVRIDSNDPTKPSFSVWFRGLSYAALEVKPKRLAFGRLTSAPNRTQTVSLRAATGENMKVLEVDTGTPHLKSEVMIQKEGEQYAVHITTVPPPPGSTVEATVRINTDSEKHPVIEVPVTLTADLGELVIAPKQIELKGVTEEPVTRQILVGAPGIDKFAVRRVTNPDPGMRYMIVRNKPNMYRVQIKGIKPGPDLNGKFIRIETDLPEKSEILVPITFTP